MWYSIAITPKCFTHLPYGIFTRDFHESAPLDIFRDFFVCVLRRCSRSRYMVKYTFKYQSGTLTFFWLKVAQISLNGNLYFSIHESLKMYSAVFSLYFGSFHWDWSQEKKWLDRKYVLLRQAGVKQNKSVVKYPLWEENIIFHCFTDIWLIIT